MVIGTIKSISKSEIYLGFGAKESISFAPSQQNEKYAPNAKLQQDYSFIECNKEYKHEGI